MNKTNLIKKLAALTLIITGALTLAACGSSGSSIPYGDISDDVYLSGDGYSITEKELYEEMRLSSSSILIEIIEKEIFKDELALIEGASETYKEDLLKYANEAIFGTSDKEVLAEIDEATKTKNVLSFIDSFYLTNQVITEADIDSDTFENHSDAILDYYKLNVAKKIYAEGLLDEEVLDKESTSFIDKDEDLQTYFDNNIKNDYDMSAITIRFVNQSEANATLRYFNIKAYRSQWFLLQDPRTTVVTGYAAEVLADLSIENTGNISEADYVKYYDKYSVNPNREPISQADVALSLDETLEKFLEIYNYIYSYRDQVTTTYTVDGILADLENLPFTKAYDDYTNTTLRTYIYNTLGTGENDTRFTSSPRLNGSYYYLAFKLQAHNEDVLQWVDEDDEFIVYTEAGELTTKAQEVFDLVKEARLTSSYISTKANERLNDSEITIYDELVELYLSQSLKGVSLSSKSSKNLIAKIGDKEITVNEFYEALESKLGVSVSIDMAIRETLSNSDYVDTITDEKREEYRSNIESIIQQFGQGYYETSGYPASMGRKNFLMLAFRATSIDEAVENVYVASALEEAYLADLESHYGEEIYQTFADYANRLQAQYFSLSLSHLLISIDMDEDDQPDDPAEYLETLTVVEQDELKALVLELMQVVYDKTTTYSSFSTGLKAIVDEYQAAGRIAPASCNVPPLDETPECRWAKYKAAGLNLLFQGLDPVTNNTNGLGATSKLDEAFLERAIFVYDEVKAEYYDVDNKFPSQYLDVRPSDYASMLETAFGWHLILATGGQTYTSAEFTVEDDVKAESTDEFHIYEHIEYEDENGEAYYLDAYSDSHQISANQIRIYLNEVDSEYGIQNLPTKVSNAISAYFAPIYTKYNSNFNQLNLLYKLLADTNYNFTDAANNQKAQRLVEINQDQFFSYEFDNANFNEVYGDWWTNF